MLKSFNQKSSVLVVIYSASKKITVAALSAILLVSCNASTVDEFKPLKSERTYIHKSKETLQCQPESGISILESEGVLISAGINVYASDCAWDNRMDVMSVCGAGTSETLLHVIDQTSLDHALEIGYHHAKDILSSFTIFQCAE